MGGPDLTLGDIPIAFARSDENIARTMIICLATCEWKPVPADPIGRETKHSQWRKPWANR